MPEVFHCLLVSLYLTHNDNLAAHIRHRFKQNGIHKDRRLLSTGQSLYCLCPSHFQSFSGNKGIERHILGFKGCSFVAVLPQDPAESCSDQTFPRI